MMNIMYFIIQEMYDLFHSSPLEEYQLNTVTYGLTRSTCLAYCTLLQLVQEKGANFP